MKTEKDLQQFDSTRDERTGLFLGRARTRDAAFTFRMPGGFAGRINRTHPFSIEPCLIDSVNPPTFFGQGVIADNSSTNGVRIPASGDSGLTLIWGITVQPYPFQQQTTNTAFGGTSFGAGTFPATGQVDVLKSGYMMVTAQGAAAANKGAAVKMCIVAGTGYLVGGFSADSVSGTFITLINAFWNGPADSNGIAEIAFNT